MKAILRQTRTLGSVAVLFCAGCTTPHKEVRPTAPDSHMTKIEESDWGKTPEGDPVKLFTLTNSKGMVVKITSYGAIVTEIRVPDRNGRIGNVVLGFDNLDSYLKGHPFFGAIAGRVANRIAKGRFQLNGKEYKLAVNNAPKNLHGGVKGFDKVVWKGQVLHQGGKDAAVQFSYLSKDGEEGYPGNLAVTVTYSLTEDNELRID